jgi:two-component system LytT family response regulator
MKAILIDDEIHCTASLQIQLKENCPEIQIMAVCNDALMGLQAIQTLKPDLIFLDIEMPRLNGFQLLDALKKQDFAIIFTTAYDQFAVKAFKYSAIDYLLKPIDDEDLIRAVHKAKSKGQSIQPQLEVLEKQLQSPQKPPEKIALAYQDGYVFVNPQEIIYCESDNNYTKFHLSNGQSLISTKSLKEVEEILEDLSFFRIHKQYLINLNHIKKYVKHNGPYVVMNNGIDLTIARNRKDDFQNRFLKF